MMKEYTNLAIEEVMGQGATYCDIRIVETKEEILEVRNGSISQMEWKKDLGFGIRVLFDGAWGFASSANLRKEEIQKTANLALSIAKASSLCSNQPVQLAKEESYQDYWATPYVLNPFTISLEEKLELLFKINELLMSSSKISVAKANMGFRWQKKIFANSEGSYIVQEFLRSGGGMQATAVGEGEVQVRSYPMSFRGQFKTGGYEIILGFRFLENALSIRDEAIALLSAKDCPEKTTSLILGNGQMVLQIHESVGHPNELDRVLGWEANFAGRSFNKVEHLNDFQYGSSEVNLLADSTAPTGLATFGYDDDGVRAKRFYVVKEGIFRNFFTTRDTASYIDQNHSNGCNRAQGWQNIPITRIPNLSLMPGKYSLNELIGDTEDGIFMDFNRAWSIDQWRLNFQFGCEIGWEIKNGKLGDLVKNPTYQGITPEFWNSCSGVCNQDHWDLIGIVNCGKGQPMQIANMSHGSAPTRFDRVKVGVHS